jgi:taurine dioxygenase
VSELEFRPVSTVAGVEVIGIDLRDEPSILTKQLLRQAWHKYAILLFRDQQLGEDDQLRVGRIFGEISNEGEYGEQNYVSNVIPDGLTPHGELAFHCDHSWSDRPLRGLMLYALEVPPPGAGGETIFADMKRVWELLPSDVRERVRDLEIVHTYPDQSKHVPIPGPDPRPGMPTSTHRLAFTHPVTGETLLFCSPRHFDRIVGWPHDKGIALAEELSGYIDRPEVVYKHTWKTGDLVIWDNIRLQHARTNFDRTYRRHLRRTQVGEPAAVLA